MAKTPKAAPENDLTTLAPKPVTWRIGEQTFVQTPATLDQLADIMDVIVDAVLSSDNSALLDKFMATATADTKDEDEDGDKDDESGQDKAEGLAKALASDRDMITGLVRIIATLPRSMPKIVAAILDAPEDYLRANLRPKEAFGTLRVFIQQNDVGSIIRDFSELFQEFKTEMVPDESSND